MGGGGIIQQHAAIRTAVNDPSIFTALPAKAQARVEQISLKGLADWSEDETCFMAAMIMVAVHS